MRVYLFECLRGKTLHLDLNHAPGLKDAYDSVLDHSANFCQALPTVVEHFSAQNYAWVERRYGNAARTF